MTGFSKYAGVLAIGALVAMAGCAKEAGEDTDVAAHSEHDGHDHDHDHDHDSVAAPSPELKPLVVEGGAPAQVVGVSQARNTVPDGEPVVVEGRLKDFVSGKAAFTMVDGAIKSCIEMADGCATPWDYCCIAPNVLASNTATVQLVGADGKMLDGNLQGVNSIDNLSTVVVTGKAKKDPDGNMTIAADKVYLR
jgi:hypothetical protein